MNVNLYNKNLIDLYFYSAPATEQSAGHKAFYLFCDNMIRRGINSYIVPDLEKFKIREINSFGTNNSPYIDTSYSKLITPLANKSHILKSLKKNRIPIVIYPETVFGNPLKAPNVIRYLGYYNKGLEKYDVLQNIDKEGLVYYSKHIGEQAISLLTKKPLFSKRVSIPVRDIDLFLSNEKNEQRKEIYYYGEKYSDPNVFNEEFPIEIKEKFKRITRFKKDSPTHDELIQILKKAKLIHIFEDTALIYEALLAGTVVNLHPKGKFFSDELHASHNEHKVYGLISKETITNDDIIQKQKEIIKFKDEYLKWIELSKNDLNEFVDVLIDKENEFSTYNELFVTEIINKISEYNKSIDSIKYEKNKNSLIIKPKYNMNYLILSLMNIKAVKILYKKFLSILSPKLQYYLRKYFLKVFIKFK